MKDYVECYTSLSNNSSRLIVSSSLYQVVEISRLETRYQSSVSVEVEGTLTMSDPKPSSELLTQITGPYNLLVFGIWRPFLVTGQFVIISQFSSLSTLLFTRKPFI